MRLVELECSNVSEAWEITPPEPGALLMDTQTDKVYEVFSVERTDSGWIVVIVEDEECGS